MQVGGLSVNAPSSLAADNIVSSPAPSGSLGSYPICLFMKDWIMRGRFFVDVVMSVVSLPVERFWNASC
jgi:hypothetical protein